MTKRLLYRIAVGILLAHLLGIPTFARNVVQKKQAAREYFERAQRLRQRLEATPVEARSRSEYERVAEAYRRVYHTAPTFNKADAAVVGVAEMLTEIGRQFDDRRMSEAAIGQYEFLRREYPGSKYRVDALFTIAEIYRDDLKDSAKAKETFQDYLKHYPNAQMAREARKAIAEIDNPNPFRKKLPKTQKVAVAVPSATPPKEKSKRKVSDSEEQDDSSDDAVAPGSEQVEAKGTDIQTREPEKEKRAETALVSGVRHWSTPDYTRIAIDLGAEVEYEAGRIPSPDRIFFDLHGTRLSSSLMGKTFDVQDGFLRKIRVAQYQRGLTRVVLDVAEISDYSAFLLPNPYRLIIDIHGNKPSKPQTVVAVRTAEKTAEKKADAESDQTGRQDDRIASANTDEQPKKSGVKGKRESGDKTAEATTTSADRSGPALDKVPEKAEKRATKVAEKRISDLEQDLKQDEPDVKAEDTTINAAKAKEPQLKATTRPTSLPTFESVAPREVSAKKKRRRSSEESPSVREAQPTADGERSLIRALGLKIGKIVVDAGHGGHDTGTIGPNGLQEKDLVLDVAMRLGKLLRNKMGADVVFTREDDTFIPLETRTAIANQAQADLFISIHANSSRDPDARGVETYYLNFTSSPEALEVAARENAVSEKSIHELQDLVKKITLKDKIDESREFAADVQRSLYGGIAAKSPAVRNRGVKKAPFIVLIGANMPSVLAEVSFLSNPADERRLQTPAYRQSLADYLYKGVAKYVSGLSGLKVASRETPRPGRGGEADR